ncbi:MAG: cell division protein FtsA [Candidatus Omnitrophota bacterium]|nr:cell division protein FtsA [Candidatus Omnitrophota bacterium]
MEKVKKKDVLTALAIGSSRVSVCVAALDREACVNLIGLGKSDGRLMGGRGVFEIDALAKAMRDALKTAREEAGVTCPKTLVSISGGNISIERSAGMVKVGQRGGEISRKNVRDAIKMAEAVPIAIEKELIHSIPQDFIVDGQEGIKNPVGLYGIKLEVKSLLITAHFPFLQNITKCLNLAGTELDNVVFSGIASSKSLSNEAEGKGVILLETDNNFTVISVFFDNVLKGAKVHECCVTSEGALGFLRQKADEIRGNNPVSKVILAGNTFVREDFIERVESVFGIPAQMGCLRNIKGSAKDMYNPAHLTSIGLALYGFEKRRENTGSKKRGFGLIRKLTRRVSGFMDEYF